MVEPLITLSDVYKLMDEPEKALEASKEILDSLEPQLIYSYVPVLHARMAEVIVFQNKNKFIKCFYFWKSYNLPKKHMPKP
jgi:hypothetical protein